MRRSFTIVTLFAGALALSGAAMAQQGAARGAKPGPAAAPVVPSHEDPATARLLAEIKKKDTGMLAVSEEDGRFLRLMIATSGAKRALEIGGASGYSAIWMGSGLRATGGKLVSIEYDAARAKELADNVRKAGLSDVVQVVSGDAFQQIPKLAGTFDFVFLDAWKKDYKRFLDLVYPRLDARGLFLAHNVVNKRSEMGDFLDAIHGNPTLWTTIVAPSGEGMSVSLKLK